MQNVLLQTPSEASLEFSINLKRLVSSLNIRKVAVFFSKYKLGMIYITKIAPNL